MIFRRNKKRVDEAEDELVPGSETDEPTDAQDPDADEPGAEDEGLDVEALDAGEWRTEGPFDVAEVEDLTGSPEAPRIDLGAMVITGFPGAELRLQMSEETQQIVSAMLVQGDSALEVGAYAAPRSGGLWSELRDEIMASAIEVGGSAALAEGPFGVELRRFIPVTTPEGEQGYQPSRMWVAEGPRWLLRGIVYGQAGLPEIELSEDLETRQRAEEEEARREAQRDELLAAFRQIVVRRGDEAMAPGDLLPLTMPQNLVGEDADKEDDAV